MRDGGGTSLHTSISVRDEGWGGGTSLHTSISVRDGGGGHHYTLVYL